MIEELIKDVAIDYLRDTDIGKNIEIAMAAVQKIQLTAETYYNDDSPDKLKHTRIGTILTFAILDKIVSGKSIKSFDKLDWLDIANKVADYAILVDGQQYSVSIFLAYAKYVDASVELLQVKGISEEKCAAISAIADQVRSLSDELLAGSITEVDYTEECLWLLLEAMVKLMSTYSALLVGENISEFINGASMLALAYGRYVLYKKEQELLTEYLEHQYQLDEEIQTRLDEYNRLLEERMKEFDGIIINAFDKDVMNRLRSSVMVAQTVGIAEKEILKSVSDTDAFFMG